MAEQSNGKRSKAGNPKGPGVSKAEKSATDAAAPDDTAVKLDPSAQALIGQQLRAVYGEILSQPVPDHLLELLEELERKSEDQ